MVHLNKGDIIYTNSSKLGRISLEFSRYEENKAVLINSKGKEIKLSKKELSLFSLTSDFADIERYKNESTMINNEINMLSSELARYKNKLKELDNNFGYLKEKYPEEFV